MRVLPMQIIANHNIRSNLNRVLFFLFIFFLPTQLGKHFFLPFSYISGVRVDYLAPTIYLLDIIIFFLAVINLKTILKFFKKKVFFIIFLLSLINIFFANSVPLAFYGFIKIIEFFIVFSLGQKMLTILRDKIILIGLFIMTFFQFLLVFFQIFLHHSVNGFFYYFGERFINLSTPGIAKISLFGQELLRPYGTFSHPNSLAGFFLLLYFYVLVEKKFSKFLILKNLFLLFSSIIIFLSFSKIAIISYLLLTVIYYILSVKKCRFCLISRIVTLVVISVVFLVGKGDPLSLQKRIELVKTSSLIIIKHLVIGVGVHNYLLSQAEYPSKFPYFINQPVHNIFLLFFSEWGLLIGGYFIYLFIKKTGRIIITKPYIFLTIILTGMFDHYWLTLNQNFILLALILSFIIKFPVRVLPDHLKEKEKSMDH